MNTSKMTKKIDLILKDQSKDQLVQKNSHLKEIMLHIVACCLESEGITKQEVELSISIIDDTAIQKLNAQYLGKNQATDVLSFPQYTPDEIENELKGEGLSFPVPLGDIVLSLDSAVRQAKEYQHSLEREIGYLVCHSMFHLLGYDHMSADEKRIMRLKEDEVMTKLGITR